MVTALSRDMLPVTPHAHSWRFQVETGTPYMLYKDACNFKSNQKNLGTIKSSNLCTEIVEYTAPDEVCSVRMRRSIASPVIRPLLLFEGSAGVQATLLNISAFLFSPILQLHFRKVYVKYFMYV